MNNQELTGFLLGCAIGFDLDSNEIEGLLAEHGLTLDDNLATCQAALRESMSMARWIAGIEAINSRAR